MRYMKAWRVHVEGLGWFRRVKRVGAGEFSHDKRLAAWCPCPDAARSVVEGLVPAGSTITVEEVT